jgi:predicted GNAT family N-acyltransferase
VNPSSLTVVPFSWSDPAAGDARRIRLEVFVDEQKVPVEEEIDAIDETAFHALALDGDGRAVGTGRMFPDPKVSGRAKIGRMAVLASARSQGVGSLLLEFLLARARAEGFTRAALSAQVHAIPFYAAHGFEVTSDEYPDAGIPHRDMERDL